MTPVYRCPQCRSLSLYVEVSVLAEVDQSHDFLATTIPQGNEVSDKVNPCHQWDGTHTMKCGDCGHTGTPHVFAVTPTT